MFLRLSGIAAALAIFSPAAGASAQDNVKVLCVTPEWCEALREPFYEKAGIRMDYLSLQTDESLVRIRAEASHPTFDVFYGGVGDPHFVAFREGLTEFYKSPMMAELSPEMLEVTNGAYLPLYSNPIAVIVNPEVLKQAGAPMPKSWRDLTDPRYKGLIGMGDPNSSDTAYVIIATLVQIFGEDEAFDYLAKLHQNISTNTRSGSGSLRPAGQGELGIAIIFMATALREQAKGLPIEIVVPEEGTGYEIVGISLVKNGPNPDAARTFIDYALSAEAQDLGTTSGALHIKANVNAAPWRTQCLIQPRYGRA
jgi:iron(III) transport system substrate-binding protein